MKNRNLIFGIITAVAVAALWVTVSNVMESWSIEREMAKNTPEAAAALENAPNVETAKDVEYRAFPLVGSRVAIWVVAELHLMFAAFVLAVPLFALIIELIGFFTGDKRYDNLAYEFTKLLSTSFSFTATLGALLTFMLVILYPKLTSYLMAVFSWTFFPYVLLFFLEAAFLYSYYYGWGKFSPKVHLSLGVGLNIVGTLIMFIANAWLTFMNSPAGVTETGAVMSTWDAITNYTWMPINVHRLIANVAFGGSIAAAYGAFKFLGARSAEEKAHYDWMGYIGNFVAIAAFLPLPFAGYWLGKEIYAYSQTLGIVLMGGTFSWLFIIQAVLIGNLFLGANYYLWLGMERIEGAERYRGLIKYLLASITICYIVWATPHSLVASVEEARAMGGAHHPVLGVLGVMSAKNTAVNILILTTFLSFLFYRRAGKGDPVPFATHGATAKTVVWIVTAISVFLTIWPAIFVFQEGLTGDASRLVRVGLSALHGVVIVIASLLAFRDKGKLGQALIFISAIFVVVFFGVYGYFVEARIRIGFSVYQVLAVLTTLISVTAIDAYLYKGAPNIGQIKWGQIKPRAQYALFFLAITFTWLMGLMGYVRAGLRQHWHVYGVMKDTSPDAFTPTLGFAAGVVSVTVLIFFTFIAIVFWLSGLSGKQAWEAQPVAGAVPEKASGDESLGGAYGIAKEAGA